MSGIGCKPRLFHHAFRGSMTGFFCTDTIIMIKFRWIHFIFIVVAGLCSADSAYPNSLSANNAAWLNDKYSAIKSELLNSPHGLPIHITALDNGEHLQCNVYGILEYNFNKIRRQLCNPKNWCDILFLHPNIKSGVYYTENGHSILNVYCGRKYYQKPENTYKIVLQYRVVRESDTYFFIQLSSDKGPMYTRNYRIRLDAIPLKNDKTFIHLGYEYDYGTAFKNMLRIYFNTIGRHKIGFSREKTKERGNPVYVKGNRGMIERNAVRYYFAVQAFMDTLEYPEKIRFENRISRWYDLTDGFKRQLYELSKKAYMANKKRESENQVALQNQICKGLTE